MRILQVGPGSYEIAWGGLPEHIRNISERLAKKHDVTVYATNRGGMLPRYELASGVKVERFKRYAPSGAYFFSLEMALRMRKVEFDIVHAHSYHGLPMHFASLAKCKKLVVSTHFHGTAHSAFREPLFKLFKPFGKKILERADNIIAVSDFEKSLLCKQFKLQQQKISVIPNGVTMSEFDGLKRHKRGFKSILYVGRLESYKGAQYLVEVLPRLDDNVVLEIVGNGPMRKALENRTKQLGVHDRVWFSQNLPRPKLLQKYFDSDVFVLLSRHEAYSIAVAEALAVGTPCIVSDTSALSEWIDNQSCFGVGFPIRLRELASVIRNVLNSAIDRKAAKKWLGTKILDWDEVVRQLEEIYAR
jgi:glycosyltransferase involved in cell wall biosynthesis